MKILVLAPYIYQSTIPVLRKNRTGFGIMVRDIMIATGLNNDVFFYSPNIIRSKESIKCENFTVCKHTWLEFIIYGSIRDLFRGIRRAIFENNRTFKDRLRILFYEYDKGNLKRLIKEINPDIVHIHGVGDLTNTYIEVCSEAHMHYLITLHGLVGLDQTIHVSDNVRSIEKETIQYSEKNGICITVISTGIKNRIEKAYLDNRKSKINVITNGTWFSDASDSFTQKDDLSELILKNKKSGKKIIYYVGNISENKNQLQLVSAMKRINEKTPSILVLFGKEADGGVVRNYVEKNNLQNCVVFAGFRDNMNQYWNLTDLNVLISRCEGFGLSIIEGYSHGVPSVIPNDLDATEDLFFPEATLLCRDRSNDELVLAINKALIRIWDHEQIKSISQKFEMRNIAEQYDLLYEKVTGIRNK